MESSKRELTLQMVLLAYLNAQLFLEIRSCINSLSQTRQERFGTTHIIVGFSLLSSSHFYLMIWCVVLQYCDGLRGPLVIYDPEDPLRNL
jgi:hypothetical protein